MFLPGRINQRKRCTSSIGTRRGSPKCNAIHRSGPVFDSCGCVGCACEEVAVGTQEALEVGCCFCNSKIVLATKEVSAI